MKMGKAEEEVNVEEKGEKGEGEKVENDEEEEMWKKKRL